MNIGIVGYGVVGKSLEKLFLGHHKLEIFDLNVGSRESINACDLAFVCVPTPESPCGSCDLSAIHDVFSWLRVTACIKSTVPPTTVLRLKSLNPKTCFSPEYIGETAWHPWKEIENHGFIIVGGEPEACDLTIRTYQEVLGPSTKYLITDSTTAELCKYMENAFLATKVAFVNQFYDLARYWGVNFTELRELWLADERIGRSHTIVTEERGYGGKCLPKDMAAIIHASRGRAKLLEAVDMFNDELRSRFVARTVLTGQGKPDGL